MEAKTQQLYEAVLRLYSLAADGAVQSTGTIGIRFGDGYYTMHSCQESAIRLAQKLIDLGTVDFAVTVCRAIGS